MPNALLPSKPVIVLVDDDPDVRGALCFSLALDGFEVAAFASAAELLGAGWPCAAACLVTDYVMPETDGIDLVMRLRAEGHGIPAILITGRPGPALRDRAARAGVRIVEKPLLEDDLAAAIRLAVAGRALPPACARPGHSRISGPSAR